MFSGKNSISKLVITSGFVYLFMVAILGVTMRSAIFTQLPVPYENILHAHSHTALLGWAFVMGCTGILCYLKLDFNTYKKEFFGLTIAILGMLISFLYQSYGAISIGFSTLFILSSYVLLFRIYKIVKTDVSSSKQWFIWAIIWFFVSTLGIWCVGPTSAILGKSHALYQLFIQFFLHFQINGWLTFVAFGLLFKYVDKAVSKPLILAFNLSLVLTFALNISWVYNSFLFYVFNVLGLILQAMVYYKMIICLWKSQKIHKDKKFLQWFYRYILIFMMAKPILQMITIFPSWSTSLASNRFLIIAFLHLILIGMVSYTFIYEAIRQKMIPYNSITITGIILWLIGFIITEIIMALQGFGVYNYRFFYLLWIFSLLMLFGIAILLYQRLNLAHWNSKKKLQL